MNTRTNLIILFLLLSLGCFAQTPVPPPPPPPEPAPPPVITFVEERAQPVEGFEAFYRFINKNLRYPKPAYEQRVEGRVFVRFTVKKDGTLSNFSIARGLGYGCDEEAIRVLKLCAKWKPAIQRGRGVTSKFAIPIRFDLKRGYKKKR